MSEFTINTSWKDARLSTSVECSQQTAENLRVAALDGLFALPRVGMGIGGLLLGVREEGQIRIDESIEIPCAHSEGPGFTLNREETKVAQALAASFPPERLMGCYFSKTRGPSALSERQTALFEMLCPEAWQVTLLLRPSTVEPSRAVLFVRDGIQELVSAGERIIDLPKAQETKAEATEEIEVPGAPIAPPPPVPDLTAPPTRPALTPAATVSATPVAATQVETPPAHTPRPVAIPMFLRDEPIRRRRRWPWFAAIALLVVAGPLWLTRYSWLPRPPLSLTVADASGHLNIRWNSDAVRGMDGGVLSVSEAGVPHPFPLSQKLLESGAMGYDRKAPRVTVMLRVGEAREIVSFLDPSYKEPAPLTPPAAGSATKTDSLKSAPRISSPR